MANLLQFIHFHRIGRRFSSDIKKYFCFLSIDSWLKQIQFRKYPALFFYKIQIWFWFFITTGIKLPPCHLGKRFQAFLEMKLSIKNWNNFKDPSTITKLIIGRIALLPLNYTRDRIILSQNSDWCLIKKVSLILESTLHPRRFNTKKWFYFRGWLFEIINCLFELLIKQLPMDPMRLLKPEQWAVQ